MDLEYPIFRDKPTPWSAWSVAMRGWMRRSMCMALFDPFCKRRAGKNLRGFLIVRFAGYLQYTN